MSQIYQRFDLDPKAMAEILEAPDLELGGVIRRLSQELRDCGYEVFISNVCIRAIPNSILVGGKVDSNLKDDFYSRLEVKSKPGMLRLPFSSGDFYLEYK